MTQNAIRWNPYPGDGLITSRPSTGRMIEWITPSGEVVQGLCWCACRFLPTGSEYYVSYSPAFWRYIDDV